MDDLAFCVNSIAMSDDSANNYSTFNTASNAHPRLDTYKKKIVDFKSNQEERRRHILIEQKKKRESLIESSRMKTGGLTIIENVKIQKNQNISSPKSKTEKYLPYNNQLMFSEWLEDRPSDFDSNWLMVVSPVGKRCLVVASQGYTNVYNKAGKLISKHSSKLPGGCKESRVDETVLDCIYNDYSRTYFILDCLSWKSHPIVDSEAEFRFYWLNCKLEECHGLSENSYENPYAFKNLPRFENLNDNTVKTALENPFNFEIDGILFYHKEGHYSPGYTPLVGWLKAYMIPEILNIQIANWIKAPSDYAGFREEINKSNMQKEKLHSYLNKKKAYQSNDDESIDIESTKQVESDLYKKINLINSIENKNRLTSFDINNDNHLNSIHMNTNTANNGN